MESSQQTVDRLKIQLAKLVGEYQKSKQLAQKLKCLT